MGDDKVEIKKTRPSGQTYHAAANISLPAMLGLRENPERFGRTSGALTCKQKQKKLRGHCDKTLLLHSIINIESFFKPSKKKSRFLFRVVRPPSLGHTISAPNMPPIHRDVSGGSVRRVCPAGLALN